MIIRGISACAPPVTDSEVRWSFDLDVTLRLCWVSFIARSDLVRALPAQLYEEAPHQCDVRWR